MHIDPINILAGSVITTVTDYIWLMALIIPGTDGVVGAYRVEREPPRDLKQRKQHQRAQGTDRQNGAVGGCGNISVGIMVRNSTWRVIG
jgi:hypothetical protein